MKNVDFGLTDAATPFDMPLVRGILNDAIETAISRKLLLPNKWVIPISVDPLSADLEALRTPKPKVSLNLNDSDFKFSTPFCFDI